MNQVSKTLLSFCLLASFTTSQEAKLEFTKRHCITREEIATLATYTRDMQMAAIATFTLGKHTMLYAINLASGSAQPAAVEPFFGTSLATGVFCSLAIPYLTQKAIEFFLDAMTPESIVAWAEHELTEENLKPIPRDETLRGWLNRFHNSHSLFSFFVDAFVAMRETDEEKLSPISIKKLDLIGWQLFFARQQVLDPLIADEDEKSPYYKDLYDKSKHATLLARTFLPLSDYEKNCCKEDLEAFEKGEDE